MDNKHTSPGNNANRKPSKDTKPKDQLSKVYQTFYERPMTMKEADLATGIMRENICRYVKVFREQNQIAVIKTRQCSVTKHLAKELTTNPELFPKPPKQLNLWN